MVKRASGWRQACAPPLLLSADRQICRLGAPDLAIGREQDWMGSTNEETNK